MLLDNLPHIHLHSYDSSMEDYGKNNTVELDLWVVDRVQAFIKTQIACESCQDFRQAGNLFFLHLLGIDTAGHAYKPASL
jgi:phosphatidylinositol glycan class N